MPRVPASPALKSEVSAMKRLESAYAYAESLPPKARDRVYAWALDTYHPDEAE